LGRGERVSLDATASADFLGLESSFRKPGFLHPDRTLVAEAGAGVESPEAYTSRHLRTAVGLEQALSANLVAGGGVGFKVSRVDQQDEEEGYGLVSLPLRLDWDRSDDLLDPRRGWRVALRLAPFTEVLEEHMTFVRARASLTHYLPLLKEPRLVLATRWVLGSMVGAERDEVPADERFYAGGGGSVRGLPFQSAGPLEGDDPLGGRSLAEMSAELRMRLTDVLGLAAFVDGGRAFEESFPGSEGSMLWGAGLGVRYYTFLGPLRLDVAVPLDRREGVDDAFQLYVSIGQAF
jgi:translocation and assembly module TamA